MGKNILRSTNFGEKSRGAKFLYKKKIGSQKVQAKDSEIEKLEINVFTKKFKIKKLKKQKIWRQKLEYIKVWTRIFWDP